MVQGIQDTIEFSPAFQLAHFMKLAAMQPYFFPYLGYYQAIAAVDRYLLYDRVAYIKRGWINRNRHYVINAGPAYFIVPVKDRSSFAKISDIELDNREPWQQKMLKRLYFNYKRAPYFEDVYPLIQEIITSEVRLLTELNAKSIINVSRYIGLTTPIITDTSRYLELEEHLAAPDALLMAHFPEIKMTEPERRVIRVLEICRREGALTFINAIGGQELYSKEAFARNNVDLHFIKSGTIQYKQGGREFIPNLSIIDVLMNCGPERTRALLSDYTLI